MDEALTEMALEVQSERDGAGGDRLFDNAVAHAGRNPLLMRFLTEIENEIDETRLESLRQPGRPAQSLHQHEAIIERHPPTRPQRRTRRHAPTPHQRRQSPTPRLGATDRGTPAGEIRPPAQVAPQVPRRLTGA